MESPPLATYIPPNPKKRVFPGGSSSCMDPEVVEIPPPANRHSNSKSNRRKEVIHHEVIDVDMDEDCGDVLLIDGKIDTNKKGKEALANFSSVPSGAATLGSMDGVQSSKKNCAPGSQNFINLDGFSSDFPYGNDEYLDKYCDDLITDDNYAILQSHFDNIDIPPGVEAPIPWLPGLTQNVNKSATASSSAHSILQNQSDAVAFPSIRDLSRSSWLQKSAQIRKNSTSKSNSSLHAQSKKDVTAQGDGNLPYGLKPIKSWQLAPHGKRKNSVSGGAGYYISHEQLGSMQSSPGIKPTSGSYYPNNSKHQVGMGSFHSSSYMPFGAMPGVSTTMSALAYSGLIDPFGAGNVLSGEQALAPRAMVDPAQSHKSVTEVGCLTISSVLSLSMENCGKEDEILKKLRLFKKFDTVEDNSDHHYMRSGSSSKQPSKNWAKKIQEEWKILEKDLPDTIYVRVYESRMDLLRAVIVGAEGTPYHDGLFFFDVFFPSSYPNVPPHVYYHSGGLRINPNLYNCGKVCLSLLNTWNGGQKEKWIPGVSTMLQVLVSIQGLILNAKPFFNEPGYANMSGSASGEKSSLQYNENTFILSLKTMVYSMRRPPKHFEDLVMGHFCMCARDILVACKAYMDGAQVGCLVRGGVQDVDEGDKSCSQNFKQTLAGHINMLVEAFAQVGAKGCERFLSQTQIRTA